MTDGLMKQFADGLTVDQVRALAIYLTGKQLIGRVGNLNANPCKGVASPIKLNGPQWNGWGRIWRTPLSTEAEIKPEDVPRLKIKWAKAIRGRWPQASRRLSAIDFCHH